MTEDYIAELTNIPNKSIARSIFEKRYLPLLFDPDPKVFNLRWLDEIAGSIFAEVDVIGEGGNVDFVIPPLKAQYATDPNNDINFLANQAEREAGIHRLKSEALLARTLPSRMNFVKGRNPEHEARWRHIIAECGYEDMLLDTSAATKKAEIENESSNSSSGNLVYDPNDDGW